MDGTSSAVVSVPASSANLGPGYDALAVALDVALVVETLPRRAERVLSTGEGAGEVASGDDNLIWRALAAYCEWAGVAPPEISLRTDNAIPLERGMGSSSAAAVAGVALGRALTGGAGSDQDLIELATCFEGHADNAAAALLGGLVVCRGGRSSRLEPTDALRPLLCIPASRQSTEGGGRLLPAAIPLAEAAANAARAAAVLAGLCGALAWDPTCMVDVLHEPARLAAMPQSGAVVRAARDAGLAACLSGAGPAVLVIAPSDGNGAAETVAGLLPDGWHVRPSAWDRAGAFVRWRRR
jgi:homoserine kinase